MIKKIKTTLKNVPKFSFLKNKDKKTIDINKFDFNKLLEKQKKSINNFLGKSDNNDAHLSNVIEDMIKQKFQLKGGYGDLIADEAKYAEFVRSLGYEYYSTYTELSKYYQDTSFQLDERKLEFCTSMYIITLEDKKNKNKVLGIRDVVNLDFEVLSKFYFTKIVILGEGVLSSVFGEDREIIFGNNDTENDGEINKYFDKIMGQAILLGASDIHIQKTNRYASLWFRIDGIKLDMGTMPIAIAKTLKRRLLLPHQIT